MSYMTKQDLEIIATFFNLVPSKDVARALGVPMPAGKWCFGPTGGRVRNSPDPTIVLETTNARGEGAFSLDGQCQWLGTKRFSLRDDFRGAIEDMSLDFCAYERRSEYRDYCRYHGLRYGSKQSALMFTYEYAISWMDGTDHRW